MIKRGELYENFMIHDFILEAAVLLSFIPFIYKECRRQKQIKTSQLSSPECLGCRVHHKKFGDGEVKEVEGARLVILFDDVGSKLFKYPDAFVNGYLQTEDATIMEQFGRNQALENDLVSLREQAEEIRQELAGVAEAE